MLMIMMTGASVRDERRRRRRRYVKAAEHVQLPRLRKCCKAVRTKDGSLYVLFVHARLRVDELLFFAREKDKKRRRPASAGDQKRCRGQWIASS